MVYQTGREERIEMNKLQTLLEDLHFYQDKERILEDELEEVFQERMRLRLKIHRLELSHLSYKEKI